MNSERLPYLDISKGLLIIFVLIYHIPVFAEQNFVNSFNWMFYTRPAFQYYFMPAFFVITGFCSIFEGKSFGIFVYKNFKILILPGFFVSIGTPIGSHLLHCDSHLINYWIPVRDFFYGGGFWFLTSLFFSKIIYYTLCCVCQSAIVRGGDMPFIIYYRHYITYTGCGEYLVFRKYIMFMHISMVRRFTFFFS